MITLIKGAKMGGFIEDHKVSYAVLWLLIVCLAILIMMLVIITKIIIIIIYEVYYSDV